MRSGHGLRRLPDPQRQRGPRWSALHVWFAVYLVALALIVFWPAHVDSNAGPLLHWVTAGLPWLTYGRIEFLANVVLFVPFGAFLTRLLRRRYLVPPLALATTIGIELVQSLYGGARTPSVSDVVANFLGALVGLLLILVFCRSRPPIRL